LDGVPRMGDERFPAGAVTSCSARTAAPRGGAEGDSWMNAIPSEVMLETEPNDETTERGGHGLPLSATICEFVVAVAALAAAVPFILRLDGHTHEIGRASCRERV